ncbi:MAG TPA: PSD1 and planctomycete cytochrome C domain-containing protein [Vicinamibacterales bacterium]|nr:PSD1 and planctomycete cytochrome C domain-containing protein [Vicinamibacterales bacterium]
MALIGRGSPFLVASALTLLAALVLRAAPAQTPAGGAPAAPVDFARDVQPLLEKHCYECHGTKKVKGRLRLHHPAFIAKGGESGAVIVAGDPEHSLLMRRVLGLDGDDRMPLDEDPLSDAELATLRGWIAAGAVMPAAPNQTTAADVAEHWAYVKPVRPALPDVSRQAWVRTPVDRFVLARLDHEQLSPSAEADRQTLLRRVTLDLTGLPPTPAEIDAFAADTAPGAYERVVDRLLASPHYGERWARPWLDLARYADTNGYEKDRRRDVWKYRDWVIDALNADMPFDRFTVEQIAGDMLPDATDAQRIATGFHRNAMTNEEGGVDPDESMYEVLVDRVNTTATVWLGTTLACAQCHNHKYDPFSQKDYFRLLAFFANPAYEKQVAGDGTRYYEAKLDLASPEQAAKRAAVQAEIKRLEGVLSETTPELADRQRAWEAGIRDAERAWTVLVPREATATGGVQLTPQPDGSILASGPNPELTTYTATFETTGEGLTGLRLEAMPDPSLPRGGPGRDAYGHFRVTGLAVSIAPLAGGPDAPLDVATMQVDDAAAAFEPMDLLVSAGPGGGRGRRAWGINALRETIRLPRHAVLKAARPFGFPDGTRVTLRIAQEDGAIGQGIGRFRLAATTAADPLIGAAVPAALRPLALRDPAARPEDGAKDLATHFRQTTPSLKATRDALQAARKALVDLQLPSTLVMQDRPGFERPSYELRERGAFMSHGERLYARTPLALPPMKDSLPANRLGLARWLIDRDNPLVARVHVNRLWEQLFGRGLVETSEDFGTQGQPPSHPELLDWLAVELMDRGWSQKTLLRTIVTSATYRQASAVTPALAERDPYNRLFARGPRFRLEAEMIRDGELAASGLLSPKMHGPSVFPSQPEGIWNMPYNEDRWVESTGEDRYRRSLYTFLRRTSPYPMHMTFDATSREYCAARRVRTNTPLQALTLLNDRASFDAARALAARVASVPDPRSRATLAFRLVVARDPKPAELARILAYVEGERVQFARRPDAAAKVAPSPAARQSAADAAAWTLAANVLLNLDETVTKN